MSLSWLQQWLLEARRLTTRTVYILARDILVVLILVRGIMASITALSRCPGLNHVHLTVQTTGGQTRQITVEMAELNVTPSVNDDEYVRQRVALLVREARAAGNTTFAQIRTFLLNREFVE